MNKNTQQLKGKLIKQAFLYTTYNAFKDSLPLIVQSDPALNEKYQRLQSLKQTINNNLGNESGNIDISKFTKGDIWKN